MRLAVYIVLGVVLTPFFLLGLYTAARRMFTRADGKFGFEQLSFADSVNLVIFVFSVVSIVVAIAAFRDAQESGAAQTAALTTSRDELANVVGVLHEQETTSRVALEKVVGELREQETTWTQTRDTLSEQLALLKEQDRRALDRLSRHPEIRLTLDGVEIPRLGQPPFPTHTWRTPGYLLIENIGDAALNHLLLDLQTNGMPLSVTGALQIAPDHVSMNILPAILGTVRDGSISAAVWLQVAPSALLRIQLAADNMRTHIYAVQMVAP
jgi:hypothetical protein